ncbi:unnamed protein product [Rangifer tarandus platyrhynchus]|uniref:Uncharacterized protein n=1 Tax=Rangifer tarandus platyrhynchus TaxID=3082113 RepID=A0AC59ZKQ3_RANTA
MTVTSVALGAAGTYRTSSERALRKASDAETTTAKQEWNTGPQLLIGKVATCVYAQLCRGTFCDKGQLRALSSLHPDKLGQVP